MILRLILAWLALSLALAAPVAACSVREGYRVPTTLALARQADAVVLARVEDGTLAVETSGGGVISVAPLLALKGDSLPGRLQMSGWLEAGTVKATRSDPADIATANPDAFGGACNRYVFAKGMTLLLFLKRKGDGWTVMSEPFARTAEDVPAFDARWVQAVREYLWIAALPTDVQQARLAARRDVLRGKPDADSRAIAADMDRELAGPGQPRREPLPPAPD